MKSGEGFYDKKPSVIHEINQSDHSNMDDLLLMFKDKGISQQEAREARRAFMSQNTTKNQQPTNEAHSLFGPEMKA